MALDKTKTDPELGKEIQDHLATLGVDTPIDNEVTGKSYQSRLEKIRESYEVIMDQLGLDRRDDSLRDTPNRVAKMFLGEIFWGLDTDNFPKITTVDNKFKYDEFVLEMGIKVNSQCEHHFVPIDGVAHIAYIPNKKVLGLSKLNRVVEYFSRRPQVQERLTEQIYFALKYILETPDIAVVVDSVHFCVKTRGIEDPNSKTKTSKLGGSFKTDQALRSEFMNLIRNC